MTSSAIGYCRTRHDEAKSVLYRQLTGQSATSMDLPAAFRLPAAELNVTCEASTWSEVFRLLKDPHHCWSFQKVDN